MSDALDAVAREARTVVSRWMATDLADIDDAERSRLEALGHRAIEAVVDGDAEALASWLAHGGAVTLRPQALSGRLRQLFSHVRSHAAAAQGVDVSGVLQVADRCDAVLVGAIIAMNRVASGAAAVDVASVVTDTLYSRSPGGAIRFVSDGARALTGREPGELIASPTLLDSLLLEEDRPRLADLLRLVRTRREPMEAVYRVRHDGSHRVHHVLDRATPVLGAAGEIERIDGILVDITERVELEARLERSEQLRSLGQLARDVAHDFNNLLVSVLGHADLLTSMLPEGSREASYLPLIISACEKGSKLSERLLQFARGAAASHAPGPTNLALVASDAAELARPAAPPHVLLDVVNVADPPLVMGDASRLGEAVLNIVLNAIQACEPLERAHVSVTVREAHQGEVARLPSAQAGCVIEVSDDGPGMNEEVLARVFEPLFTTRGARGGSGLGCAMAYGIAVDHGGLLEVESTLGAGTLFRFLLPASDAAAAAPPEPRSSGEGAGVETRPIARPRPPSRAEDGRARILVVDDEPSVRFLLRDLLEGAGFRVTTASGGLEAIERVREQPRAVDIAILDVMMAPMDGTETYALLKQMAPSLPIIFCTGHSDASRIAAPGVLANATIVQKPFRAAQLIRAVRQALLEDGEAEGGDRDGTPDAPS